jgi:hypothetical protein
MSGLLRAFWLSVILVLYISTAQAAKTWLGGTSNWATGSNWAPSGAPGVGDDVEIGIASYTMQPSITSGSFLCNSIKFGSSGPGGVITLTVDGALAVTTSIQQNNSGLGSLNTTITGAGTITCASLTVGDTQTPVTIFNVTNVTTVKSNIALLSISGNLTVKSASTEALLFGVPIQATSTNAVFSLANDNAAAAVTTSVISVGGSIITSNTNPVSALGVTSHANVTVNNTSTKIATLKLGGTAPLSAIDATYNLVDFYVQGAGTGSVGVEYTGTAAQPVYSNSTTGLDVTPSIYQNIAFSGIGTKTMNSGNVTIAGNWTSTGGTITTTAASVIFQGGVQTLTDNASGTSGVVFKNVTFSGNATKTITGTSTSAFAISGTGVLNMSGTSTILAIGTNGKLTLNSNTTGTATVATIPSGCSITGSVNVQRYFFAGTIATNTRNYRLLSSPVNANTVVNNSTSTAYATLSFLNNNPGVYTGGPGGTSSGFTVDNAAPTIYLYKENLPASNASFNSGNFKGLANITSNPLTVYNDAGTAASVSASLWAGNGYMLYYCGNNISNITAAATANKQTRVNGNYIDPDAATGTAVGTLNQGKIQVKLWWNSSTALSKVQAGFNLVGNPYASTIDWDTFSNTSASAAIYGPGLSKTIYVFNYKNKNYGTYQAGGTGVNNASRYIASGQGFFVQDTVASGASLTFTEAAKTTVQPSSLGSSYLLMGLPVATYTPQILHIKLSKDSINTDEAALVFESDAKNTYEPGNDAVRINGIANVTTLATYDSQATKLLAINHLHSIDSTTRVKLYVNSTGAAAINVLEINGFDSLDPRYDAFLIDHYKKDSLQISLYGKYNFNLRPDSAATFGADRFELVFHKKGGLNYRLLSFTGTKLNNNVALKWNVEAENNYTAFTLERADVSGNYTAVYNQQSNGSGSYTWVDKSPLTALNNYRLKQVDAFDHTTYSSIVPVDLSPVVAAVQPLMIYPNPAVGQQFNVKVTTTDLPAQLLMRVIGLNGQTLMSKTWSGDNVQQNVSELMPGTYIVEVSDNATKRVIGRVKISKP